MEGLACLLLWQGLLRCRLLSAPASDILHLYSTISHHLHHFGRSGPALYCTYAVSLFLPVVGEGRLNVLLTLTAVFHSKKRDEQFQHNKF
jgi:hypothetical protein